MVSVQQRGVTLVEVVIGVAIVSAVVVAAAVALGLFIRSATEAKEKTIALFLAEEGIEYVRFLRSEDWTNITGLSVATDYYFAVATTTLATSGTPEVIDGYYERSFMLDNLYRNSDDDIVASTTAGAVIDTDARYVTVTVRYDTSDVSLSAIVTNLHDE